MFTNNSPPSKELAKQIFEILVLYAGANERDTDSFIRTMTSGTLEYKIGGKLGFGGRFSLDKFRVACYTEDETPERMDVIMMVNQKLKELKDA